MPMTMHKGVHHAFYSSTNNHHRPYLRCERDTT